MINSVLVSRIQQRLDDIRGRSYTASQIKDELTLASKFIASHPTIKRYLFPTTSSSITLTSGTDTYALPTDYNFQVQKVVYNPSATSSTQLGYIPLDKVHKLQNSAGAVLYYTLQGTNIVLADVPAAADNGIVLKVWYAANDGSYANDASETTLGLRYPHLLVDRVSYQLSMSEQDGEIAAVADRFGKSFDTGMQQAVQELSQAGSTEEKYVTINTFGEPL